MAAFMQKSDQNVDKKVIKLLELWQLWLKRKKKRKENSEYNRVVITTLKRKK